MAVVAWWNGKEEDKHRMGIFKHLSERNGTETLVKTSMYQKFNETKHLCALNPKFFFFVACFWCRICAELQPVTLLAWQTSAPCVTQRGAVL